MLSLRIKEKSHIRGKLALEEKLEDEVQTKDKESERREITRWWHITIPASKLKVIYGNVIAEEYLGGRKWFLLDEKKSIGCVKEASMVAEEVERGTKMGLYPVLSMLLSLDSDFSDGEYCRPLTCFGRFLQALCFDLLLFNPASLTRSLWSKQHPWSTGFWLMCKYIIKHKTICRFKEKSVLACTNISVNYTRLYWTTQFFPKSSM